MKKYQLIFEYIKSAKDLKRVDIFSPEPYDIEDITDTHSADYVQKLLDLNLTRKEQIRSGFPLTRALIDREFIIASGTVQAAQYALKFGAAMNIAGGTHHAYKDRAEGFCLLNDQAIAANHLIRNNLASKILIVDLDVHQGNGTAAIFENNANVFTFSMHGAKNYPFKKEKSNLDIALENNTSDSDYLSQLINQMNLIMKSFKPDFMFYLSGVDVLKTDKLGKLSLSLAGCKKRDEIVIQTAYRNNIPLVCCMGGGYSEDIKIIVEAHLNTFKILHDIYQ